MTITHAMSSIIDCLEKTNDPAVAYFSFVTDDSGEFGAIQANKEGLRLFALELLKKSMEMEEKRDGNNLCFPSYEWLVSDAGYDLIRCIKPEYASRTEILSGPDVAGVVPLSAAPEKRKGCLGSIMLVAITLCAAAAVVQWFS